MNGMVLQRIKLILSAVVLSSVAALSQDVDKRFASQSLKVDVELVTVDVSVTNEDGRHFEGLDRGNFRIWEDKIEQNIEYVALEDSPVSVGIIFDVSASMRPNLEKAKDAALTFLAMGNSDDEYFLVDFSDRPRLPQEFTRDVARVKAQLTALSAKGATSLYDAVYLGLEKLRGARNPRKALLVISDGEDNRSRYNFSDLRRFAAEQDVKIYAISIDNGFGPPMGTNLFGGLLLGGFLFGTSPLQELTDMTGGETFVPRSLNRLEDICKKIATSLKSQYSIGYRSTNLTKDGAWRKVTLKLEAPKAATRLHVRFKKGYYAATSGVASR
jgi:Ca-activated chloride channel family protein